MEELQNNTPQEQAPEPTPGVAEQAENAIEQDTDQKEWEDVENEVFDGSESEEVDELDSSAPTPPNSSTEPQEQGQGDNPEASGEKADAPPTNVNNAVRDVRFLQRQAVAEAEAIKQDIREVLFKDTPTELRDADGDPIRSADDVMKLIDPRTNENFTREDAIEYFNQATQKFQAQQSEINARTEAIANVNLSLKDEADVINEQYGALLQSNPELQKALWSEYQKTLQVDPKTGVITGAPVSLASFYHTTLQPYAKMAEVQSQAANAQAEAQRQAEEARRVKTRSDRSDIYASGKVDTRSEEDKEWEEAEKEVLGI